MERGIVSGTEHDEHNHPGVSTTPLVSHPGGINCPISHSGGPLVTRGMRGVGLRCCAQLAKNMLRVHYLRVATWCHMIYYIYVYIYLLHDIYIT